MMKMLKEYGRFRKFKGTILSAAVFAVLAFLPQAEAKIYIGPDPSAVITINEGESVDIPVFLPGDTLNGKAAGIFAWRENTKDTNKSYYDPTGTWVSFGSYAEMKPVLSLPAMIEFFNVQWRALSNTQGMGPFNLFICMTGDMSGKLANGTATSGAVCGTTLVDIKPGCAGIKLSQASLIDSFEQGQKDDDIIEVKDSCGNAIDFTAAKTQGWISLTQTKGVLTVSFDASLLTPGTYTDDIAVSSADGKSAKVSVTVYVTAPTCAGMTADPVSITKTVTQGQKDSATVNVTDSCGNAVDFTAAKTQSWISLSISKKVMTVNIDASSLSPGNYSDTIALTSTRGDKANVTVSLTVAASSSGTGGGIFGGGGTGGSGTGGGIFGGGGTGSCTPASISVWPGAVTVSVQSGSKKTSDISVTDNCGKSLSYTASVTSGSPWLSAPQSGSGTLTLTIATTSDMTGTYKGSVQIAASGYAPVTVSVNLTMEAPCQPASATINPSPVTATAVKGSNASSVNVTITDNCQNPLAYTVNSVKYSGAATGWISSPAAAATGTGTMTVAFNASGLAAGSYSGSIEIAAGTYPPVTVNVSLTVNDIPSANPGSASLLQNQVVQTFSVPGQSAMYFYLNSNPANTGVLQITMEGTYNAAPNCDMLVKYAGPTCDGKLPTVADLQAVKAFCSKVGCQPKWSTNVNDWFPPRYSNNLYYTITGDSFELIEIKGNPRPNGCYYVMIYNTTSQSSDLRLVYDDQKQ